MRFNEKIPHKTYYDQALFARLKPWAENEKKNENEKNINKKTLFFQMIAIKVSKCDVSEDNFKAEKKVPIDISKRITE